MIDSLDMAYGAAEILLAIDPTNTIAEECLRHRKRSGVSVGGMSTIKILEIEKEARRWLSISQA